MNRDTITLPSTLVVQRALATHEAEYYRQDWHMARPLLYAVVANELGANLEFSGTTEWNIPAALVKLIEYGCGFGSRSDVIGVAISRVRLHSERGRAVYRDRLTTCVLVDGRVLRFSRPRSTSESWAAEAGTLDDAKSNPAEAPLLREMTRLLYAMGRDPLDFALGR